MKPTSCKLPGPCEAESCDVCPFYKGEPLPPKPRSVLSITVGNAEVFVNRAEAPVIVKRLMEFLSDKVDA